jgi:uncharacterized protein (DUF433 family)
MCEKIDMPHCERRRHGDSLRPPFFDSAQSSRLGQYFTWVERKCLGARYPTITRAPVVSEQMILTPPSQSFLDRVTWDGDQASGWRPSAGPRSPVFVRPDVRFGRPSVKGIGTGVLAEHADAGEDEAEIAAEFGLGTPGVRGPLSCEQAARAA